jgi:signal transduction histidine kinase
MNHWYPRSVAAWVLIVIMISLIASQLVAFLTVGTEIQSVARTVDLYRLGERAASVARAISQAPPEQRRELVKTLDSATLKVSEDRAPGISAEVAASDDLAELEDLLSARLSSLGVIDLHIAELPAGRTDVSPAAQGPASEDAGPVERELSEVSSQLAQNDRFRVSMQLADNDWINFDSAKWPVPALLSPQNALFYFSLSLVVIVVSIWAVLRLISPYRQLEHAARSLADDLRESSIPETGNSEVRSAIRALNRMQEKLRDYVGERERLAAALAHDLRTPLTRLRLRCELLNEAASRELLVRDIHELESIVDSVVDFASGENSSEPEEKIDVVSLVQTICDNVQDTVFRGCVPEDARPVVAARPASLLRCMSNLISNAVRHGGSAEVSISCADGRVDLVVDDSGPGIPEEELENVKRPFYRLDKSRNRESGGSGLGLAIADSIAKQLNGRLSLENRIQGGVRASLTIPVA